MIVRVASPNDISRMMEIRNGVHENKLSDPNRFSVNDYAFFLLAPCRSWVSSQDQHITGFCSIDLPQHNIWALFIDPAFEGKGAARLLLQTALFWYFSQTKNTLWLSTEPGTRAEKFYLAFGFSAVSMNSTGEWRFEMSYETWTKRYGMGGLY